MSLKIPTSPAFYKKIADPAEYWAVALTKVITSKYQLLIADHEQYDLPIDGWDYHETPPQSYLDWVAANTPEDDEE